MSGSDRNDDKSGFPSDVFRKMQEGHDKFMQEFHEEGQRFQHDIRTDNKSSRNNSNFFLSFKDFVDTNLNSLADSFRSLPNNIAELRAKMEAERERRKADDLEVWQRWTGLDDSPDHCAMLNERSSKETKDEATNATLMLLREAYRRNAHVDEDKIRRLYHDPASRGLDAFAAPMLSPGGACYYQSDSGYNAPSTAIFRFGPYDHRWLSIDWFKRSPYSPITLEATQQPDNSLWRAAFEDLLNAALDKPMHSEERIGARPRGEIQSTHTGPGLDWMLSLQCRGILPPQLPALYNSMFHKTAPKLGLVVQAESIMRHPDAQQLADEIATPAAPSGVVCGGQQGLVEQDLYEELDKEAVVEHKNPALLDYQQQLAQLEQQNRDRLLSAQQKQKVAAAAAAATSTTVGEEVGSGPGAAWKLYEDLDDVEVALCDAVERGDGLATLLKLSEWHRIHGTIADVTNLPESEVTQNIEELVYQLEALEQQREALGVSKLDNDTNRTHDAQKGSFAPLDVHEPKQKVDVLSSLTTTRTTRHPDGTTTTTVTLKQKFADGREESEEKIHTYHEPKHDRHQPEQTVEKPKFKGWFWS
ncbi:hypothetical protein LTR78_000064 [Recurvomyces mirabilis]|uniref:Uncharacterized protein n=1 Tax=Recurvomyces mirabilis TaxID=574656 RepID=A0AAE0WXC4_9PEZI|nr:hypothetical protein LTR78_000064 [Recurvomyces mirabilis]KAK5161720.1 hypothetical protein LTS14_000065 [Recurvomyces mirabilis]